MENKNTTLKWLREEMKDKIIVEDKIFKKKIRGIYGIFSKENDKELCIYIGKAINVYSRLLTGNGHLVKIKKKKYMFEAIKECMNNPNKKLIIKILEEVPYLYDNYNRDVQRLAFAEYSLIEKYQEKEQCLNQLPEGSNQDFEKWNLERQKLFLV
ncbi:hypothetical protein [Streptococcus zalophi]|uniref:hypothetical protein n=1 Tax=Streptococcus zalophi TaxID=640031 RepID=UPI00215CFE2A|nr:hypothetical protein [Streptococcus zalophi]MCR8967318.1 hypothetical protein [Streptococcus zalophi]